MVESLRELTIPQAEHLLRLAQAARRRAVTNIREAEAELREGRRAQEVFETRIGQIEEALTEKGARSATRMH